MSYAMYLAGEEVPVVPGKLEMKITGQNKTLQLMDGSPVNLLAAPGLTEVSFELLLPAASYPFAQKAGRAAEFLTLLEKLKTGKAPFQWIVSRKAREIPLFHTNLTVSLESYQVIEDAKEGFDLKVKVNLKQYRRYGTRVLTLRQEGDALTAREEAPRRETSGAPKVKQYTVVKGDCLWNIAKRFLGDGSRYREIYNLNKDKVKNPNLIYPGQVLTLPG